MKKKNPMDTSTVKCTTSYLAKILSEGISQLYIDYEFSERKFHKNLKNILIYKAKHFMLIQFFFEKTLHILKDGASSVQVDILNMCLSRIWLKHEKIYINQFLSMNLCNDALILIMKNEYEENIQLQNIQSHAIYVQTQI